MTRMTGPDCAVMCNLINTHTHTHTCRKERVSSVAANSDNLGSNKEAGGGAQGAQGSSKICTSRESVSPSSRLIRGFRNKTGSKMGTGSEKGKEHVKADGDENTHTHTHTHTPLSRLIGGFRNKYH